ncbi:MAG: type II toxin-antitoxin system Phd/YefM family antitoxin [Clostridiales bacterium]|nr:type II toxin-antitoxin system Phd/YefM family antitoxin [Roseburia sp.]MDD7638451.1 type II toxin-antitoxin system Phd/YefM family antitoxin [Clostridiales bacterium]MDY4112985.1 type II toxin-antitoxin system Phd/YefM family antitoxin [Roseburia sp.]
MTAISVTKARENIYQILTDVNTNSQPITITNNRGKNGVLISEDDWNAIQETLYLNSIPGVAESIIAGGNTSIEDCVSEDEVDW